MPALHIPPGVMKANPSLRARVIVADDHPFFSKGLADFLNQQKGLVCCATVSNAADLKHAAAGERPDLLILDLRLGSSDGLELLKELKEQHPALPVLVISQSSEVVYGERALRAGASGYIMKEQVAEEVLAAVHTVLRGEIYASRNLAMLALQRTIVDNRKPAGAGPVSLLSDREIEVFDLLGNGKSTRDIAADLKLSVKTIETYRENIKHKLGLRNAAELLRAAVDWVENGSDGSTAQSGDPK
jgi:DNA-binding NarL/FixJ family response regulator